MTIKMRGVDDSPNVDDETWQVKLYGETEKLPLAQLRMASDDDLPPDDDEDDKQKK